MVEWQARNGTAVGVYRVEDNASFHFIPRTAFGPTGKSLCIMCVYVWERERLKEGEIWGWIIKGILGGPRHSQGRTEFSYHFKSVELLQKKSPQEIRSQNNWGCTQLCYVCSCNQQPLCIIVCMAWFGLPTGVPPTHTHWKLTLESWWWFILITGLHIFLMNQRINLPISFTLKPYKRAPRHLETPKLQESFIWLSSTSRFGEVWFQMSRLCSPI